MSTVYTFPVDPRTTKEHLDDDPSFITSDRSIKYNRCVFARSIRSRIANVGVDRYFRTRLSEVVVVVVVMVVVDDSDTKEIFGELFSSMIIDGFVL
jgi:hypothetical protein